MPAVDYDLGSMNENNIGTEIIDAAFRVHTELGAGLLESSYMAALHYELNKQGMYVEKNLGMPVVYDEIKLDCGYRIDLLVNKKVIVEIKSVTELNDVHMAQILTYLKLSGCKLGYLLNFNTAHLKNGIKRVVRGRF
jgi:GxxExxY protein